MAITIHLGTYKTATTSLQRLLKEKKASLAPLGYDIYAGTFDRDYRLMKKFHDYLNDQLSRTDFLTHFEDLFLQGTNENKVISEEMILGPLQKGPSLYGDNIAKFIGALDELKVPYKIVMVTRRIDLLLESLYTHNIAVSFTRKSFENFYEGLDLGQCHWSKVINEFEAGTYLNDISVLPFEICMADSGYYVEKFMAAMGLPSLDWGPLPRENRSIGSKGYSVIRSLHDNRLLGDEDRKALTKSAYKHFTKEKDSDTKVDFFGKYRRFITAFYREDNELIAEKYFPDIPREYYEKIFQ